MSDKRFSEFPISEEIVSALADEGIETAFPIQAMTLPIALEGRDIIGQAKTGTGKTLGFGIPTLQGVVGPSDDGFSDLEKPGAPQALIVTPTRELCKQVANDLRQAGKGLSARVMEIYGGVAFEPQIAALERGVEIIVGTPGRLIDLEQRGELDLSHVKVVVLDEADEMLDLGFLPDVETLVSKVSADRHTMLFSATMPGPVIALARRFMDQPTHIRASEPEDDGQTVKDVAQFAYRTHPMNKVEVLSRILQAEGRERTIVFVKTKRAAARLSEDLTERGFAVGAIHGDLGQGAREQALRAFRSGKVDVLVATDVAARGIDVPDVTHVVNYQSPEDDKTYLHRIGRTARAGASGTAVTFVDWDGLPRWGLIAKGLGLDELANPEETYHTSDHLYTDLNISQDVTGKLPRHQRTREGLDSEKLEDLGGRDPNPSGTKSSRGSRKGPGKGRGRGSGKAGERNRSGRKQRTRTRTRKPHQQEGGQPSGQKDQ